MSALLLNRLRGQQLAEIMEALQCLERERIFLVTDMRRLARAAKVLDESGISSFDTSEMFFGLKAATAQAMQKQLHKGVAHVAGDGSESQPSASPGTDAERGEAASKSDIETDGPLATPLEQALVQSEQPADVPAEAPPGQHLADLYHTRTALAEIAKRGDVRLVRGDYLVDVYKNTTEPVKRHQDIPEEAFMRHEELLDEATMIVAVSYCWCSKEHPDPDRYHLPVIAKMVSAILAGRLASTRAMGESDGFCDCDGTWVKYKDLRDAGFAFGASAVAVLWDYMSLPQVERSDAELETFKRGLRSMNAWYGSRHVTKLILTDLPKSASRASYTTSGWTCFEREVANLISPPWCMLTLARGNSAYEKLFKEKHSYEEFDYIRISYDAFQAGARSGPMTVEKFDALLDTLTFTNGAHVNVTHVVSHASGARTRTQSIKLDMVWWHGSLGTRAGADKTVVRPKYHECFSTLVEGATELSLCGYDLEDEAMEKALQVLLTHCRHVEKFDLARNPRWKPRLETFVQGVAPWASSLKTLDLSQTKVLGDVQLFGQLVHLQRLCVRFTKVTGDVGGLAPLLKLEKLDLRECKVVGDCDALQRQLPKLSTFYRPR